MPFLRRQPSMLGRAGGQLAVWRGLWGSQGHWRFENENIYGKQEECNFGNFFFLDRGGVGYCNGGRQSSVGGLVTAVTQEGGWSFAFCSAHHRRNLKRGMIWERKKIDFIMQSNAPVPWNEKKMNCFLKNSFSNRLKAHLCNESPLRFPSSLQSLRTVSLKSTQQFTSHCLDKQLLFFQQFPPLSSLPPSFLPCQQGIIMQRMQRAAKTKKTKKNDSLLFYDQEK